MLMTFRVVLIVLLTGTGPLACAQPARDADPASERIIENLKLQLPQLRQAQTITLGPLSASDVPGFRQATLTINGRNRVPVLVRDDGQQTLLLAAPPVDTRRSLAEVRDQLEAETAERRATLAEASDGMPTRGPADAPVTMVTFSDFQCPYCARSTSLVEEVLDRYGDRVRFVYLHFPLPNHGWAKPAAIAAQCAARQDEAAFWTLYDAYFTHQGKITEANMIDETAGFLAETDVDLTAWRTCATDDASEAHQAARQRVEASIATGEALGVRGTPTFFIDGEMMRGPRSVETFGARIEAAAAQ